MADQFLRAYRLIIGSTEIDATAGVGRNSLRIQFSVQRDEKRVPNNAAIAVWNLAESTREGLGQLDSVPVSLEVGYVADLGLIFLGDLRSAISTREGPEFITRVQGGDGETKLRISRVNRTFSAGTTISEMLVKFSDDLGIDEGNVRDIPTPAFKNGATKISRTRTVSGLVYDEMESLCRSCGLRWSIQDSALQIRTEGQPVADREGPLLSPASGLIGVPQKETTREKGTVVSGVTLLRPDLIPGIAFRVESEAYSGNLVCIGAEMAGNSHGGDWYTRWVGRPYA